MKPHPMILALTSEGTPHQWLHWETAICLKTKNQIAFELGDSDHFYGGMSRLSGVRSHISVGSIISVKSKPKQRKLAPILTNKNLFARDISVCGYCGKHQSFENLSRDHIIPKSKGGKDIWTNVVSSCKKCNNMKSNKTPDEAGMELLWIPYVPAFEETLILSNRKILFDQAKYIAPFLPKHSRAPKYLGEHFGIVL